MSNVFASGVQVWKLPTLYQPILISAGCSTADIFSLRSIIAAPKSDMDESGQHDQPHDVQHASFQDCCQYLTVTHSSSLHLLQMSKVRKELISFWWLQSVATSAEEITRLCHYVFPLGWSWIFFGECSFAKPVFGFAKFHSPLAISGPTLAWLVLWWIGCFLLATGIQKGCHSHAQLEIMFENMVFICWKIEFEILTYSPNTPTQKLDPWRTRIYTLQNDPGIYGFRYHSEQCQRKQWRYYLYLVILVR